MAVKKIIKKEITNPQTIPKKKLRVAAYCRVSTELEGQQSSFKTQVEVYRERIEQNPDWEMAGIYADQGITGTSTARRKEFMRMIDDCEAGKIDYILTKSISRFARNTLECLSYIRHLQELGIQILFEEDNLDTGQYYSEMLLTVLAAFAQEESRSISSNIKWGIRKRYQEGIDRWVKLYGYERNENGTYQINPDEAAVVRDIFARYEKGMSMAKIAEYLTKQNCLTPHEKVKWDGKQVASILENEKYAGDIMLQKMYTVDHLTHRIVKNDCTTVPAYYIDHHHEPIVSPKTFQRVRRIRKMKSRKGQTVQYPFDDKLRCPFCGSSLVQRKLYIQDGGKGWNCERGGDACHHFLIRSHYVESAMLQAYRMIEPSEINAAEAMHLPVPSAEAEKMRRWKEENPVLKTVEYYWLDELVDHITFDENNNMHVFWKCSVMTMVPTGITKEKDDPIHVAKLQRAYEERQKQREQEKRVV
ncbi:MAG: recombinase family protein [Bariatricus sp.]